MYNCRSQWVWGAIKVLINLGYPHNPGGYQGHKQNQGSRQFDLNPHPKSHSSQYTRHTGCGHTLVQTSHLPSAYQQSNNAARWLADSFAYSWSIQLASFLDAYFAFQETMEMNSSYIPRAG